MTFSGWLPFLREMGGKVSCVRLEARREGVKQLTWRVEDF